MRGSFFWIYSFEGPKGKGDAKNGKEKWILPCCWVYPIANWLYFPRRHSFPPELIHVTPFLPPSLSLCSTAAGRWRIGIVSRADGILYIIPNAMYYTHEIFRIVQIILPHLLLLFLPIKTPWSEGRTPLWHLHVSLYLVYYKISYFWRNEPALWIIFALLRVTQSTLIQFRPTVARSLSLPPSPTRRLLCMQMEEGGWEGR